MGVNNINSPLFATEATEISKSDTINSTTFLNGAVIYVGAAGDLNVIVAGEKREGQVVDTTITEGGAGYTAGTDVATTGGAGSGLTVDTTVVAGEVTAIAINDAGTGYRKDDIITISGGTTDATFTVDSISNLPTLADAVEFSGMQAGTTLNVFVDYVLATDTTAGGLVSLK